MYLTTLQEFLDSSTIPDIPKRQLTLLEIARIAHYENIWSNIYAFFLNSKEDHKLDSLFVNCLLEIIKEKAKIDISTALDYEVFTEYTTQKNGRIDILLVNRDSAIIIENKVRHILNNDLHDYWDSIERKEKVGVVLSLYKIPASKIYHPNFINITHQELCNRIMMGSQGYSLDERYRILFNDLFQNIMNMTNPPNTDLVNFYFKNREEVNKINEIRRNFIHHVIKSVDIAREKVDEILISSNNGKEEYRYYLCPEKDSLMFTVVYNGLFTERNEILLIVELKNELISQCINKKEKIKQLFNENEKPLLLDSFYVNNSCNWKHFAKHSIKPSEEEILYLDDFIADAINNSPLLSIYRKLKANLVQPYIVQVQ